MCDYAADRQFLKLKEASMRTNVQVIRGQYGTAQSIPANDLVVGDIIKVNAGDRVPADCIMFEEQDITVDERVVLGESGSAGQEKQCLNAENILENPDTILLKDSLVMTGSGRAVVCAVGSHTLVGKEAVESEFDSNSDNTPLQDKLEKFAGVLGFIATLAAGLALVLFTLYWFFTVAIGGDISFISYKGLLALINNFQICLALLIVSVPEGLPLAISMALAFSFEKLTEDNVQIIKPEALETAGSLSNICTSITSVLT